MDCENGGLRYSQKSTVLHHSSPLFKGRYLGIKITFFFKDCKNHNIYIAQNTFLFSGHLLPVQSK